MLGASWLDGSQLEELATVVGEFARIIGMAITISIGKLSPANVNLTWNLIWFDFHFDCLFFADF